MADTNQDTNKNSESNSFLQKIMDKGWNLQAARSILESYQRKSGFNSEGTLSQINAMPTKKDADYTKSLGMAASRFGPTAAIEQVDQEELKRIKGKKSFKENFKEVTAFLSGLEYEEFREGAYRSGPTFNPNLVSREDRLPQFGAGFEHSSKTKAKAAAWADIQAKKKMSQDERKLWNANRVAHNLKEIDIRDDEKWSYEENYVARKKWRNETYKQGSEKLDKSDVALAASYGFVDAATFGAGHAIDMALQAADITSKSYWSAAKDTWLGIEETEYTRVGEGLGGIPGFFAPAGWLGTGFRVALAPVKGSLKAVSKTPGLRTVVAKAAGTTIGKGVGKAVSGTAKGIEKTLSKATAVSGKTVFEFPEKAIGQTVGRFAAAREGKFIKTSSSWLRDNMPTSEASRWMNKLKTSYLGKMYYGDPSKKALTGALSKTLTQAWKSGRGTTMKKLLASGEKDAIEEATKIFESNIIPQLKKHMPGLTDDEIVRVSRQLAFRFRTHITAPGAGKNLRQLITNPFGVQGMKTDLGLRFATTAAEGALNFAVHRAAVMFNTMLGHEAMITEASDSDGFFEEGQLYLSGARKAFEEDAAFNSYWHTLMTGAIFHTGAGTKFIPSSLPKIGELTSRTNPIASFKRFVRGPNLSKKTVESILAKEITPAHAMVIKGVERILGKKSGESLTTFLSRAAHKKGKVTNKIWDNVFGLAKKASAMSNKELAVYGAMIKSERRLFGSPLVPYNNGSGGVLKKYPDGLNFNEHHLRILNNPKGVSVKELQDIRFRVEGAIESNMALLKARYQNVQLKEFSKDFAAMTFRGSAVFFATGGLGMVHALQAEEGHSIEATANLLTHIGFSAWAGSNPAFREGLYLSPSGWDVVSKSKDKGNFMPGWTDARLEVSRLERELFYMGAGATDFIGGEGFRVKEAMIVGVQALKSHKELLDVFAKDIQDALEKGVMQGLGQEELLEGVGVGDYKPTIHNIVEPGEKPISTKELGLNPDIVVKNITTTEREQAWAMLKVMGKMNRGLHEIFTVDGKSPDDGAEWVKAMDSNELRRDYLLSIAAQSFKNVLINKGHMELGEPLKFTAFVKATDAKGQEINANLRGALQDAVTDLRMEQKNTNRREDKSWMVDYYQFEGDQHEHLNRRSQDLLDMARLLELNVHATIHGFPEDQPGGKIVDYKRAYQASEKMGVEIVTKILDEFDAALAKMDIHESLRLGELGLKEAVFQNFEAYGRSKVAELLEYGQLVALSTGAAGEEVRILSSERILESFRAGGILGEKVNGRYVLKDVSPDVIELLSERQRNQLASALYMARNERLKVFRPSKEFYEANPQFVVTEKSDLKLWSSQTFEAEKHPLAFEGIIPEFTHKNGIIGALTDVGIPMDSYNTAIDMMKHVQLHRNANLTDVHILAMAAAEDAGYIEYSMEHGVRVKAPVHMLDKEGRRVLAKNDHGHDMEVLADALRSSHGDPTATGELRFEIVTKESMLRHEIYEAEAGYGRRLTDAEISKLQNDVKFSEVVAFQELFQELINMGNYDGWSTPTNRLDSGIPDVVRIEKRNAEDAWNRLQLVLKPLAKVTDRKKRRQLIEDTRRELEGLVRRYSANDDKRVLVHNIGWLHSKLGRLLTRNDAHSIRELHFLLKGVGALVMTQDGGRPNVRIDFASLKDKNLEKTLERLEILTNSHAEGVSVREEFLRRMESAPEDLARHIPERPLHEKGTAMHELLADLGFAGGPDENTTLTISKLTEASVEFKKKEITDIDEYRKVYSRALEEGIFNIATEGTIAVKDSPYKTREEMLKTLDNLTDAQIQSIYFSTSDQRSYYLIEPGQTVHASVRPSDNPTSDVRTMESPETFTSVNEPVFEVGEYSSTKKKRKYNPLDELSDWGGFRIHEGTNIDRVNGRSMLYDAKMRENNMQHLWLEGLITVDPSENGKGIERLDEYGIPIRNRIVTIALTEGRNLHFEAPYTKAEIEHFVKRMQETFDAYSDVESSAGVKLPAGSQNEFIKSFPRMIEGLNKYIANPDVFVGKKEFNYDIYEAVRAGAMSYTDLSNVFRFWHRANMFGEGGMHEAIGDLGLKNNKRIKQVFSNSAQRLDGISMEMAYQRLLKRAAAVSSGTSNQFEEAVRNMSVGEGSKREFKFLAISEEELAQISNVEQLDGNLPVHFAFARIFAESMGYDTGFGNYATIKAFTHGAINIDGTSHNSNFLTKPLLAVGTKPLEQLMETLGVAGFIPQSTMKVGKSATIGDREPLIKFVKINVDGTDLPLHEAALKHQQGGHVNRAEAGVLHISPSMFKFQNMPSVGGRGGSKSGQMALDWHPEVVAAFNSTFPVEKLVTLTTALLGDMDPNSLALSRAMMTDKNLNPIVSHGDLLANRASLMNVIMGETNFASPGTFFRRQIENRILSIMKDTLFKGHTKNGGDVMFGPDGSNAIDPMEVALGLNNARVSTQVTEGMVGIKRTKRLNRDANGNIVINSKTGKVDVFDFSYADADAHQAKMFQFKDRINYYNKPSSNVDPIRNRETTWTDYEILGKGLDSPIAGVLEEWYAGGRTGVKLKGETPLQKLFTQERLGPMEFDRAAKVVAEIYREIFANSDVNELTAGNGGVDKIIDKLRKSFTDPESKEILDTLGKEIKEFLIDSFYGEGGGLNNNGDVDGHVSQGNIKNTLDMLFGHRHGERWSSETDGWQYEQRMRDASGTEERNDHNGKTPVTYGQLVEMQRAPSIKPNDTIPMHILGYLREQMGNQMIGGRKDTAGIMEADNDGDHANFMNSLPKSVFGEAIRNRNIMGGVNEANKPRESGSGYSYLIAKGQSEFSSGARDNQYLRYLADQLQAEGLKGQMISIRAALSKMVSDNVSFRYTDKSGSEVEIRPLGEYAEVMDQYLPNVIEVLTDIQKILDVPGSFMPEHLKNIDMDEAVFSKLITRTVREKREEGFKEVERDDARTTPGNLSQADYKILKVLRRLYSKIGSISRDDFEGGEKRSKNWQVIYDIAKEYQDIFNGKMTHTNAMKKHIVKELDSLSGRDAEVDQIVGSLKFSSNNNELFPDAVSKWVVRIGDAVNSELILETEPGAGGRDALATVVGESEIPKKLRRIYSVPAMKNYIRWLKSMVAQYGDIGGKHYKEQLLIEKAKMRQAGIDEAALDGKVVKPESKQELGRLVASTTEALAVYTTMGSIHETMFGDPVAYADGFAKEVLMTRNRLWAMEISQAGGRVPKEVGAVKDRVKEVVVDSDIRSYFESFILPDRSNFDELAIRLLEPQRLTQYEFGGSDYWAFKSLPTDIISGMIKYDPVRTENLLARLGENAMIATALFKNGSIRNIKEINSVISGSHSWEGRIGSARNMIRESMDFTVKDPINTVLKQLATRRPSEVIQNKAGDYVAVGQGSGQIQIQEKLLRTVMESAINLELNPGKNLFVDVRVSSRAQLPIPGIKEFYRLNFSEPLDLVIKPNKMSFENRAMAKDAERDFRIEKAERLSGAERAKEEKDASGKYKAKKIKPGDVDVSSYDLAKIRNDARKRFGNLLQIISSVAQVNESIKTNEIKDFDDGVLAGRAKVYKDIRELGTHEYNSNVREVNREAAKKAKKTGKPEEGC